MAVLKAFFQQSNLRGSAGLCLFLLIGLILYSPLSATCADQSKEPIIESDHQELQDMLNDKGMAEQAAIASFPGFLQGAWEQKKNFGFHPEDRQEDVTLAAPIFVYGFTSEDLKNTEWLATIAKSVTPVGEWIFPVQVKGEYRSLFGVRLLKKGWKGVYLGNPYLAATLQALRQQWSGSQGDRFLLVSCVNPRSFFFVVPEFPTANLTPLTYLKIGDQLFYSPPDNWANLTPAAKVVAELNRFWTMGSSEGQP